MEMATARLSFNLSWGFFSTKAERAIGSHVITVVGSTTCTFAESAEPLEAVELPLSPRRSELMKQPLVNCVDPISVTV